MNGSQKPETERTWKIKKKKAMKSSTSDNENSNKEHRKYI